MTIMSMTNAKRGCGQSDPPTKTAADLDIKGDAKKWCSLLHGHDGPHRFDMPDAGFGGGPGKRP